MCVCVCVCVRVRVCERERESAQLKVCVCMQCTHNPNQICCKAPVRTHSDRLLTPDDYNFCPLDIDGEVSLHTKKITSVRVYMTT